MIDPAASLAVRDAECRHRGGRARAGRPLSRPRHRASRRAAGARDRAARRSAYRAPCFGRNATTWPLADIFRVQDDITRQLAGAMAVRLDQLEQARIATKPPGSLEVYDLVLRGRRLVSEGTRASNREARQILAEAVAKDPAYAPAQVALGEALRDYAHQRLDRVSRGCHRRGRASGARGTGDRPEPRQRQSAARQHLHDPATVRPRAGGVRPGARGQSERRLELRGAGRRVDVVRRPSRGGRLAWRRRRSSIPASAMAVSG